MGERSAVKQNSAALSFALPKMRRLADYVAFRSAKGNLSAEQTATYPRAAFRAAKGSPSRGARRHVRAKPNSARQYMRTASMWGGLVFVCLTMLGSTQAQQPVRVAETAGGPSIESFITAGPDQSIESFITAGPDHWKSRKGLSSAIQVMLLLTVLSLAPAVLLMTTSFVRIIVVLGLLRQALGVQQLPPSQVLTSIALFMTILLMTPVWTDVYNDAIQPYTAENSDMSIAEAWSAGVRPIRRFMSRQIDIAGNAEDVMMFYQYANPRGTAPSTYEDVPLQVLLPAFMLSELKVAFLIGFQIYLPFLILDVVIASVTISMGMMMLPPVMISLPFKLMLFVLVDGWRLVIGMLMESFAPYT